MKNKSQPVQIAVLGAGTVGAQVIRLLGQEAGDFSGRVGAPLEVSGVMVRNPAAQRDVEIPAELLSTEIDQAIDGADVVVELIGGLEPAREYVLRALNQGKSVVTGNKALLAAHGPELFQAAAESGADLYYEAAVAGAVPVVYGLRESLAGDRITQVMGIVNGTTNFILDAMTQSGWTYEEALAEAQRLGFAEADPTADVEGLDAAAKCAILASLAFHTRVGIDDVAVEGITGITTDDISEAAAAGQVVKLLAIAERITGADGESGVTMRVHPTLVPNSSPLATVAGAFNAVIVEGEAAGRLMFYGQGAGGAPTASAVLSDVVAAASHKVHGGNAPRESVYAQLPILPAGQAQTKYQMRMQIEDTLGVLAQVAQIFADNGVSIHSVSQTDPIEDGTCTLTMTTHAAPEANQHALIDALAQSDVVRDVISALRRIDS